MITQGLANGSVLSAFKIARKDHNQTDKEKYAICNNDKKKTFFFRSNRGKEEILIARDRAKVLILLKVWIT